MKCDFIAILDDSKEFCNLLKTQMENVLKSDSLPIYTFQEADSLRNFLYEKTENWGILFLDIVVGDDNGISQAISIKKLSPCWKIVFITGFTDYLSDIFKAEPNGLLFKPIDDAHLSDTLNNIFTQIETAKAGFLTVNVIRQGSVRLKIDDIIYIESDRRILHIYMSCYTLDTYAKLDEYESLLPNFFIRCHRSFIVNANRIRKCKNQELILFDDTVLPISRPYRDSVRKQFMDFLKPSFSFGANES